MHGGWKMSVVAYGAITSLKRAPKADCPKELPRTDRPPVQPTMAGRPQHKKIPTKAATD